MGLNRYYVLSSSTNRYFGRSALEQLKLILIELQLMRLVPQSEVNGRDLK